MEFPDLTATLAGSWLAITAIYGTLLTYLVVRGVRRRARRKRLVAQLRRLCNPARAERDAVEQVLQRRYGGKDAA